VHQADLTGHRVDPDITPQRAARIAGLGYVALFVLAIFANFFVRERLVDPDDAAATFRDLADHDGLVRMAIVAFLAIFVIDVVVAWALHQVLRPTGAQRSALAAWFRIVYTVFLGVGVLFLFTVLRLLGGAEHLAAFDQGQLDAQVLLALDAFNATWLIGLVAFGLHLVLVGRILVRSGIASTWLGGLLVVAGTAYVFDTVAYSLVPGYADHETVFTAIVAVPSVVAEFSFLVWLLRRGAVGFPQTEPSDAQSALTAA
jgi:hypothetical protein